MARRAYRSNPSDVGLLLGVVLGGVAIWGAYQLIQGAQSAATSATQSITGAISGAETAIEAPFLTAGQWWNAAVSDVTDFWNTVTGGSASGSASGGGGSDW